MKIFSFLFTILPYLILNCSIIAAVINIPADQPDIQSGVMSANNGDTVLVAPGTYYENVNFLGKQIVVASHFIRTDNLDFITSTIIDGSNPSNPDTASCVMFYSGEDSLSVLQGFTLTGGTGTKWVDPGNPSYTWRGGGGVFSFTSSPTIKNNIIRNNTVTNTTGVNGAQGGGTLHFSGNPRIINNLIMNNEARYGAGIVVDYSGAMIKNNIIYKNFGGQDYGGGGIWTISNGPAPIIIENNHIIENSVTGSGAYGGKGGAMFIWMGTATARNNIIWGNTQSQGGPIAEVGGGNITITYSDIESGFTGTGNIDLDPLFGNTNLYLESNSPCIDAGDPDVMYHDPEDSSNPGNAVWPSWGTTTNDMGAYGGPERNMFPVFFSDNLLNQPESVVYDSVNNRYFVSNAANGNIIQINNLDAQSYFAGYSSSIRGITIFDSILYTAGNGGIVGFNIYTADTTFILPITGAQFLNDIVSDGGNYLYVSDTNTGRIYKVNISSQTYTTFVNSGLSSPNGLLLDTSNNRLILCSFRTNSPIQAISLSDSSVSTIATTTLTNLDGLARDNQGNIYVSSWGTNSVYKYDPNFTAPPQLVSSGHSGPADICINMQLNILAVPNFNSDTLDFVDLTLTSVGESEGSNFPNTFKLYQNYPNPFNPRTFIKYELLKQLDVNLLIFDGIGQKIKTLSKEKQGIGNHSVVWDGTNDNNSLVSSGIYYCVLKSGKDISSKKLILLR